MKRQILPFFILHSTFFMLPAAADTIDVARFNAVGPYEVHQPLVIDSLDAAQKKYSADAVCDWNAKASFSFLVSKYTKAEVKATGTKKAKVFINGKEQSGKQDLQPGRYDAVVKYVADTTDLKLMIDAGKATAVQVIDDAANIKHPFSLADNMLMKHYNGIRVSPSGKYAIVGNSWFETDGKTQYKTTVIESATGKVITKLDGWMSWMSKSDRCYYTRTVEGKKQLVAINPATLEETVLNGDMPDGNFTLSPTEDFVIIQKSVEGPKKEDGVYEIINPDDRQPGWRNRGSLSMMDLNTGIIQPLTYSNKNIWLNDISDDGKYIIFSKQSQNLLKRPTSLTSIYRMELATLKTECLVDRDGFISDVTGIPGTEKIAVVGSADAFGGIGRNMPDSLISNWYEHQLFILDAATKKVDPVTKYFNPSVSNVAGAKGGMVYFTAENADSVSLYRLDLKTSKITTIKQPLEVVGNFSVADNGTTLLYYGSGACTANRLYSLNTKTMKPLEIGNINADRMADIQIGTCEAVRFMGKNGYEITGHAYLPANLDKSKKYPMIVHYYGGCSPTSRRFGGGSHYPAHYWNALGYVVLIVNPSGAAGFGQEWGARHVNTAGEGVAEDIIEATEWFADHNDFVNKKKIGCVSASYGGFMTQLLLEKTDLFACGISHAGISDHTSYWGEGYWGYSYSEISMADSYPWNRKDLYVDRSTLFNAEKVHSPLLFTHGTADTNVPIGESIQMYNALKLLGKPTAFVMVEGENHGIMDYNKRIKWINTMVAWFERYLKDDDAWWNAIYTPKEL